MDISKIFIDNYNNGFIFGELIIRSNDNIEIKVIKVYLKSIFFYFEAFNFEANKEKTNLSIDYNSKIINYTIVSSLTNKYELTNFNSADVINLIKFVDEYGY